MASAVEISQPFFYIQAKHVFKDYPSGVRYVEFKHGGEDTKNWAGYYGVKMSMSAVFVGQKRKKRAKRVGYSIPYCIHCDTLIS